MHEERQPTLVDVTEVTYGKFSLEEHCCEIEAAERST